MPTLEVYDTVRTKTGEITGTVERTHLGDASDVIQISDFLIIAHVEVPQHVILEFATSGGRPPKGYVFVVAAEDAQGAFLAGEDDLELLSRSFDIGDSVKNDAGSIGTVIDVSEDYDIRPVWLPQADCLMHISDLEGDPSRLSIRHVPASELKAAEDVFEECMVSLDSWLGMVEMDNIDVVLRLPNGSIVAIADPVDLFLPITDLDKPLVHLPDFDNISRPHTLSAFGGFSSVIATDHPRIGSFVVASRQTMRTARYLSGSYDKDLPCHGRVIAVVPRNIFIDWLVCSPFVPLKAKDIQRPPEEISVYRNIDTYKSGDQLKRIPGLRIFDLSLPPGRSASTDNSGELVNHFGGLHPEIRAGDCVRFRNPTAAAVKYQDAGENGSFHRIHNYMTGGWDINVFNVMSKTQTVKVMWYDGSFSATNSSQLSKFESFEDDFRPTDIVVGRAGLKMQLSDAPENPDGNLGVEFNEMKFFEHAYDLCPDKVGIIQAVDARERVAKVRWYQDPHICLRDAGSTLSSTSLFGTIGSETEDLSIFEIMKFPAFAHTFRNFVIIPPQRIAQRVYEVIQTGESQQLWRSLLHRWSNGEGDNAAFHTARVYARSRGILRPDLPESSVSPPQNPPRRIAEPENHPDNVDWVGEIVSLGLDGNVTVRLSGATQCHDEVVSADHLLAIIDVDNLLLNVGDPDEDDSIDVEFQDLSDGSTISESISYEGGERIDNDSEDENWISAEDEVAEMEDDAEMTDAPDLEEQTNELTSPPKPLQSLQPHQSGFSPTLTVKPNFERVLKHAPDSAPVSFAILDTPPPLDQHQPSTIYPPSSSRFLKRMRYEHKILLSSLPPSIYVRTYESDLSLLRCLIIGPTDTPYEHAPFIVDLALPSKYPAEPPIAHFHSWTSGLGRINPNLYEEGKICLSLLGTWPGKESKEQWSKDATILQLLVSLQGLVMVKQPFYNEAGFEDYKDDRSYDPESAQYSEKAYVMARGFVKHALVQPPGGLEDVLAWIYFQQNGPPGMLQSVLKRGKQLIDGSMEARKVPQQDDAEVILLDGAGVVGSAEAFLRPLSKGAMIMLKRLLNELGDCVDETRRIVRGMMAVEDRMTTVPTTEESGH